MCSLLHDPEATILDVLDDDCWRMVLDRLDLRDVLRSERVSRGWQRAVLEYLKGIRRFDIEFDVPAVSIRDNHNYYSRIQVPRAHDRYRKIGINRHTFEEYHKDLQEILQKVGPGATHVAADCFKKADFETVVHACPLLQHLTIFTSDVPPIEMAENCTALKAVLFMNVPELDDDYLSRLVQNAALEELAIYCNSKHKLGPFLTRLRSPHLKTLKINTCDTLYLRDMHVYLEHLSELRRLELNHIRDYSNSHEILNHTPKLEYLSLSGDRSTRVEAELVQSIGRLKYLKYLNLRDNKSASDALLAAVARGCPDLRALQVGGCPGVSGRAVVELCAARAPTLAQVYMHNNHNVSPEHVRAIIACYHNIQELEPAWPAGEIPQRVETGALRLIWSGSRLYNVFLR